MKDEFIKKRGEKLKKKEYSVICGYGTSKDGFQRHKTMKKYNKWM